MGSGLVCMSVLPPRPDRPDALDACLALGVLAGAVVYMAQLLGWY